MTPVTPVPDSGYDRADQRRFLPVRSRGLARQYVPGTTPMVLADIPQGSHTITLKMDGFQDWSSTVNVDSGSYAEISGTLVPGTPSPQPTKSPVSTITIISAIGICGAAFLVRKEK